MLGFFEGSSDTAGARRLVGSSGLGSAPVSNRPGGFCWYGLAMDNLEVWINTFVDPRNAAAAAQGLEQAGYDGVSLVDNQAVAADPFVLLGVMAQATTTLRLGTGTSNPVTRHSSILASAAATIAAVSNDRMVLSVGRGLSANFELGLPPASLAAFEKDLRDVRSYLHGERVEQHGTPSSLKWLRSLPAPPVPLEVTATGPKVIALAALHADYLAFAVGADPDRLSWAIDHARMARAAAGLDPDGLRFSAYVQAYPHPEMERAVALARGPVSGLASLSGMAGNDGAGQRPADREQFLLINEVYDKRRHVWASSPQAVAMDPEFVRRFAAIGPVDQVVARLRAIVNTGVTRLHLSFPGPDSDPSDAALTNQLLAEEVLPQLRSS